MLYPPIALTSFAPAAVNAVNSDDQPVFYKNNFKEFLRL
jgi:hypothetical protein